MKTKFLNIFLLLILVTSVTIAQEQPRPERMGRVRAGERFRGNPGPGKGEFLNLTEEQKEAAKQINFQTAKELKPFKDELRELEARHQTLATADKPDLKKINESIEKIGSVKTEIAKIQAKQFQNFRGLLTDEQKMKFDTQKGRMIRNREYFRRG